MPTRAQLMTRLEELAAVGGDSDESAVAAPAAAAPAVAPMPVLMDAPMTMEMGEAIRQEMAALRQQMAASAPQLALADTPVAAAPTAPSLPKEVPLILRIAQI